MLVSLPSSLQNLSKLTSLNLKRCNNLKSLPTALSNLTHLTTPLYIAGKFPLPSDMDWSQFHQTITFSSYLEYMMRMNNIDSILPSLLNCMARLDPESSSFKGYQISEEYELIIRHILCKQLHPSTILIPVQTIKGRKTKQTNAKTSKSVMLTFCAGR